MDKLTFYWYPKCGTCRDMKKWLDKHGFEYEAIDLFETPPSKSEMEKIYKASGLELKKLFNTSGIVYRELGLKDKVKMGSEDELLEILSSNGRLIKRPILTDWKKASVGFKEENLSQIWL